MSKKEQLDLFLRNFVGSKVEIMLNLHHEIQQANESETLIQKNPLAIRGFILDVDDAFVYLGETPNAITRFCKKAFIVGGEILKEDKSDNHFDELLNKFPTNGNVN